MSLKYRTNWAWKTNDIKLILQHLDKAPPPIIHICSGSSGIGDVRLDRYNVKSFDTDGAKRFRDAYKGSPTLLGHMNSLPFKDGIAGTIICDPPYDAELFKKGRFDDDLELLVNEFVRILKPSGKIIFYAPWIIKHTVLELINIIPNNIGDKRKYFKLFSVSFKSNGQLGDYS
jgi:hypothetical protein